MRENELISVIICTHNRKDALERYLLPSLFNIRHPAHEIIFVIDGSTDGTEESLKKYQQEYKNITIVKNAERRGLCYSRNLGIKHSSGKIVVFTDDDCAVENNWLEEIMRAYNRDERVSCVGGRIYIGNSGKIMNPHNEIFGGNVSFSTELFNKFSFDAWLKPPYWFEEIDLMARLKRHNYKIAFESNAIVYHFASPGNYRSSTNLEFSALLNNLYITSKNMGLFRHYIKFFPFIIFLWIFSIMFFRYKNIAYAVDNITDRIRNSFIFSVKVLFFPFPIFVIMNLKYKIIYSVNNNLSVTFKTLIKSLIINNSVSFLKIMKLTYVLLIEIPVTSKLRHWLEEFKLILQIGRKDEAF